MKTISTFRDGDGTSLAHVIKFKPRKQREESPLTPELKEFIDRVIVPILVKEYLAETAGANQLAERGADMSKSVSSTAAPTRGK